MRILSFAVLAGLAAAILLSDVGNIVAAQDVCALEWKPVWAIADGSQRTCSNACRARISKAQTLQPGPCLTD
ncbi:MAG: hypothetical protein ABSA68_05940 [Xanthobacteraceae bacterium]|jgi:hypothetical protein